MADFTFVRAASNQADPASITFPTAPAQGNLLIAIAAERSGGNAANFTITGTGWTKQIARTILQSNSTYRRTFVVWWKVAGASEPTTISVDDGTANTKGLLVAEYAPSVAGTWSLEASVSNDNGATADAASISTGTTASVPAGDLLLIGAVGWKQGGQSDTFTVTWASSNLTNNATLQGGAFGRGLAVGSLKETTAGTKTSTATLSGTNITNNGLAAGLLVFSFSEGGGPPPSEEAPSRPRHTPSWSLARAHVSLYRAARVAPWIAAAPSGGVSADATTSALARAFSAATHASSVTVSVRGQPIAQTTATHASSAQSFASALARAYSAAAHASSSSANTASTARAYSATAHISTAVAYGAAGAQASATHTKSGTSGAVAAARAAAFSTYSVSFAGAFSAHARAVAAVSTTYLKVVPVSAFAAAVARTWTSALKSATSASSSVNLAGASAAALKSATNTTSARGIPGAFASASKSVQSAAHVAASVRAASAYVVGQAAGIFGQRAPGVRSQSTGAADRMQGRRSTERSSAGKRQTRPRY